MTKKKNSAKSQRVNANSFGQVLKLHTFGESHGVAFGAVIEGCPAGLDFSRELITQNLNRRRPNQSNVTSSRNESDSWQLISGVFENKTLGTPITIVVPNKDARSQDYQEIARQVKDGYTPRPGHADDLWFEKYGHSDVRGGGRASGRETLSRVIGGSIAQMINLSLAPKMKIRAFTESIHEVSLDESELKDFYHSFVEGGDVEASALRMPSELKTHELNKKLIIAKNEGLSFGGTAKLWIEFSPKGLGQPVFNKLKSDFAAALMGIGAVNGIEFGAGFEVGLSEGSQFHSEKAPNYGGVRGGLSTGELIDIRLSFKPTSSVLDVSKSGRHDPCIVPRAIPVIEAMAHLVMADHLLWKRLDKI